MRRLMSGAMVLAAAFALGPFQLTAQQGQRGGAGAPGQQARPMRGAMGMRGAMAQRMGPGVEGVMRMRERLKLTDSQLKQLDAIRSELVQRRMCS